MRTRWFRLLLMAIPAMRLAAALRWRSRERRQAPVWSGGALVVGIAIGAALAFVLDPDSGRRRRRMAVDRSGALFRRRAREASRGAGLAVARAGGVGQRAIHTADASPPDDDVTLGEKVMTELFADPVVKSTVNVNVEHGVVYLRGELPTPDKIKEVEARTRKVAGVGEVQSLLHLPKTPAPTRP
jgi:hyperosmotically inducible periplasmic protein